MLNADRFKDRSAAAGIFFELVKFVIGKEGGQLGNDPFEEEQRLTSFLDTAELALHRRGFALRLREELGPKTGFQVDLKFRDPDRYLSAAQDLSTFVKSNPKFEEDILPPFLSKFSHSAKIEPEDKPKLDLVGDAANIFKVLKGLDLDQNAKIATVNGFIAKEVVMKLCKFKFGDQKKSVEAGLTFWYLNDPATEYPLIAECSFSFKAVVQTPDEKEAGKMEDFEKDAVEGVGRVFSAMQKHGGWLDLNKTTKAAFAIES